MPHRVVMQWCRHIVPKELKNQNTKGGQVMNEAKAYRFSSCPKGSRCWQKNTVSCVKRVYFLVGGESFQGKGYALYIYIYVCVSFWPGHCMWKSMC